MRREKALVGLLSLAALTCPVLADAKPRDRVTTEGEWLAANAHELPNEKDVPVADAIVQSMLGGARIIGLGESTHGTAEFFEMKARIISAILATGKPVVVAMEACPVPAHGIDAYIKGGSGDSTDLVASMEFWTLSTAGVRRLVEDLRQHNFESATTMAHFAGMDMQDPAHVLQQVAEMVAPYSDELADRARSLRRSIFIPYESLGAIKFRVPLPTDGRAHQVRLHADIRTRRWRAGWAGLWCHTLAADGTLIDGANNRSDAAVGTSDWAAQSFTFDAAPDADAVYCGVTAIGLGEAWADDIRVFVDGSASAASRFDFEEQGPSLPSDLDQVGTGYEIGVTDTDAPSGRRSLRIMRTPTLDPAPFERFVDDVEVAFRTGNQLDEMPTRQLSYLRHLAQVALQGAMQRAASTPRDRTRLRDEAMAQNVAWLAEQYPEAVIVVWAHNEHVGRFRHSMGAHLARAYQDGYRPTALLTGTGEYAAMRDGELLTNNQLVRPPRGSLEDVLAGTGVPRLWVDLRAAPPWFGRPQRVRSIGAAANPIYQFFRIRPSAAFDGVLWVQETRASTQVY